MQRRWLSGILICLLLLTALPTGVLAAGAGGKTVAFSSTLSADRDIVVDTKAETVTYNGNWSFGLVNEKGAVTAVPRLNPNPRGQEIEENLAVTQIAHDNILTYNYTSWWWGSPPGSGGLYLTDYTIGFCNLQVIPAWIYTVSDSGNYNLYPSLTEFTAPAEGYSYYFAILVNEKMVWPQYNGDISYGSHVFDPFLNEDGSWYKITSETTLEDLNSVLEGVSLTVKSGDRVEFAYRMDGSIDSGEGKPDGDTARLTRVNMSPKLEAVALSDTEQANVYLCIREGAKYIYSGRLSSSTYVLPEYTGTGFFVGYDINGDGVVDAYEGSTIEIPSGVTEYIVDVVSAGEDSFADYYPTYNTATSTVEFHGSWTIGRYNTSSGQYDMFVETNNGEHLWASGAGGMWDATGGGFYLGIGKIAFSGCTAEGAYVSQTQYTVKYNGVVSVDYARLTANRQVNPTSPENIIAYNLAIYKNGEKIWPTDTDWYVYEGETLYPIGEHGSENILDQVREDGGFPLSVEVEMGDTLEFRIQQGNTESWMFYADPVVTYTELNETPMVGSTSVTVGQSDLGLNAYVQLIGARENAVAGLLYWTEAQTGYDPATGTDMGTGIAEGVLTKFTYRGLSAKQMSDVLYVMPYATVDGEDPIYGEVAEISVRQYVENARGMVDAETDAFLVALLNYGAEAQKYFNYNRENLANESFDAEESEIVMSDQAVSVYAQSGDTNAIRSVSLICDNRLGFKFMIGSVAGAGEYKLEYADNAEFTGSSTVDMMATASGNEYKGIVYIDNSEILDTIYVRAVVDGEAGATLTYSVGTYVNRMQNTSDNALFYLMHAILAFGEVCAAE